MPMCLLRNYACSISYYSIEKLEFNEVESTLDYPKVLNNTCFGSTTFYNLTN